MFRQEVATTAKPNTLQETESGRVRSQEHVKPSLGLKQKSDGPVCCKLLADEPSWDLGDDVSPEEGAMDHPHRFWIPVELCFLSGQKNKIQKLK